MVIESEEDIATILQALRKLKCTPVNLEEREAGRDYFQYNYYPLFLWRVVK